MPQWIEILLLGSAYVGTGGAVFAEWGKDRKALTILAIVVSLLMSGYFWKDRIVDLLGLEFKTAPENKIVQQDKIEPQPPAAALPELGAVPAEPKPQVANVAGSTSTDSAESETGPFLESLKCIQNTCKSEECIAPFRSKFPASPQITYLYQEAIRAANSNLCATAKQNAAAPVSTSLAPAAKKLPGCAEEESKKTLLPTVRRWAQRAMDQASQTGGIGKIEMQGLDILSVSPIFNRNDVFHTCGVSMVVSISSGQKLVKVPFDNLLVDQGFDSSGNLITETQDGGVR